MGSKSFTLSSSSKNNAKEIGNFKKKHNFLGQALDFLPPRKPSLYVSRVDFFFFEYHEYLLSISGGWNNICPVGN